MKIPVKPVSISLFTAIFVALFLLLLFIFGRLAYHEIEALETKFQVASKAKAEKEIQRALELSITYIESQTEQLAKWEEVSQQLQDPMFYSYWYRHRAKANQLVSQHTIDIAIYNIDGNMLGSIDTTLLPSKIDTGNTDSYIIMNQFEPLLTVIKPITDQKETSTKGYVATLSRIIPQFLSSGQFTLVDIDTLRIDSGNNERSSSNKFIEAIQYELTSDSYADTLKAVMTDSVLRLAGMAAILSLIIFPLATRIMGQPIKQIAEHIDMLKKHADSPVTSSFQQPLLIQELDKIRQSLNDYHNQLNAAHSTLDKQQQQLSDLSLYDPLTGIKSRAAFDAYWNEINDVFEHNRDQISLILFDIDHFKAINDTYGHEVGDRVLVAVSQILKSTLTDREQIYRLSGDEFITVLTGISARKTMLIAKQVHYALNRYPFKDIGLLEPIRLSMGIAHSKPENLASLSTLQWQVNVATFQAKRPGQSNIVVFSDEMASNTQGLFSSRTSSAVFEAISKGTGLIMHYQPIVNMATGEPHYYEALVRIGFEGKLIMPSNIFPLVEAKGLEVDLDRRIFTKVLIDMKKGLIPTGTGISINLSAPSITESELFNWLEPFTAYMDNYKILLEITETAMITQMQKAQVNLSHLQSMGFRIALDDFGSGYSSLRYLGNMPVDVVKFDLNLTHLIDKERSNPILSHLTKMILECGYLLVAEGVENATSARKLGRLGFEYGQGFYFGRPAAAIQKKPEIRQRYPDFSA
jgi:diguanylate cyclase (GGDEF)-like protein